ncbi:hypothetical protein L861_14235 [Litchfieldella anticariensis FP35 = DSM 16096]|uniref:Uncharacterized protein n=1 Tax=Litchfieldella anticariensis (strain DSM 16096 / CECT 5854 / CIP 108499 / LMG 22089 / FP35) TaxID=1121939 RepID=S2KJB5_LITA3|nr:hypothetical protein L861_14235 [Halomonas anticariensis FP35 = DSM 16096]
MKRAIPSWTKRAKIPIATSIVLVKVEGNIVKSFGMTVLFPLMEEGLFSLIGQ